jgi:hypothetical protein
LFLSLAIGLHILQVSRQHKVTKWAEIKGKVSMPRVKFMIGLLSLTLYTASVSAALSPVNCVTDEEGNFYLQKDPSVACYDQKWFSNIALVSFFLIFYPLAVPIGLCYLFFINRKQRTSPQFLSKWGFLVSPYRPRYFWWEVLVILKRTIMVLMSQFLASSNVSMRIGIPVMLQAVFIVLDLFRTPYKLPHHNSYNIR